MMRGDHTEAGMVRFQKRTICNHPYLDEFFNNHPILDDSSRPLFGPLDLALKCRHNVDEMA